jgi:hypothetical protein
MTNEVPRSAAQSYFLRKKSEVSMTGKPPGQWLVQFSQKCRESGFRLADYIAALSKDVEHRPVSLAR